MKRISSLVVSCLISLCLSTAAFGGDMPGPGAPQQAPKHNRRDISAICEPSDKASETAAGAACQEATTDLVTDAIIIAIQTVTSLL
jgi:hypothetical protein